MREEIISSVARTLTLLAVADAWEGDERDTFTWSEGFSGAGPGEDWDDVVPSECTPIEATKKAREIVEDFEARNGRGVVELGEEWDTASGCGVDRFGHCLAMQSLGHGVGLGDDIPYRATYVCPEVGYFEFYAWDFSSLAFLEL